jgi:hypothetical protein
MTTRAERKAARRDLAAWMREHGIPPTGEAWRLATDDGCRDVPTLLLAAAASGVVAKRLPDGSCLPGGLKAGDILTDTDGDATVVGSPVVDPDTGEVWVTVSTTDADGVTRQDDRTYTATMPVDRIPAPRTAPAWILAAAADYRGARDSWEQEFEATTHTSYAPGLIGRERRREARGGRREVTDYLENHPAPVWRDYLANAAAALHNPDA